MPCVSCGIYSPCPIRPEHSHILEYLIIRTNTACRVRGKHKNVALRDYSCCVEKQRNKVIWPLQKACVQCLRAVNVCECVEYPFEFVLLGVSGL